MKFSEKYPVQLAAAILSGGQEQVCEGVPVNQAGLPADYKQPVIFVMSGEYTEKWGVAKGWDCEGCRGMTGFVVYVPKPAHMIIGCCSDECLKKLEASYGVKIWPV